MKLEQIVLSALVVTWLGCSGAQKTPPEPIPEPIAPTASPTEPAAQPGEAPAVSPAPAAQDRSATALGPQFTAQGVRFNYKPAGKPGKIYLAGNFNDWNPANSKYVLTDPDGDGIYSIIVPLASGTYQYKFVIDGTWTKDPYAPQSHPDGFGGQNGKFQVP